ncbi:MAG: S49 family peptidase [Legionellales bacterium]|nr:S49 family peptidase [Legionellales bacterium]
MSVANNDNLQPWERTALQQLLTETLKEQKRARRWKIFFRTLYLIIFIFIILLLIPDNATTYASGKSHTALVIMKGELMDGGDANAADVNEGLDAAFKDPDTKAVLLEINSPGGSPVQAGEIYQNIIRLENAHPKIKVYAVCTDVCASGAYYVAAAANYIYADKASLVGSIGVLMDGFGFVDTLNKVGVERRLMTSGSEKGFLDPFSPVKPQDQALMQNMLDIIHTQFIQAVKDGRGTRLQSDPLLFSGLVWTGQQAQPLGLIDGIATPDEVVRQIIKIPNTQDFTVTDTFYEKFANRLGSSFARNIGTVLGIQTSGLR